MSKGVVVIAGSGQAGLQTATSLRQEGFDGKIIMFGDEAGLPYQRPPLSKAFLKEGRPERLLLRAESFFESNAIDLVDRTQVKRIDRFGSRVEITGGKSVGYDHLILATGTRNRVLPIPGATLRNIVELRTLQHAEQLRSGMATASHLIIIGGGFIGLEIAAVARMLGLAVTVIEAANRPIARALSSETSAYLLAQHLESGVDVRCGVSVSKIIEGGHGLVGGVELSSGEKMFGDLVLIAAGVVPNEEIAQEAQLETGNGIRVDDRLRTSDPKIFAIGDCAEFQSDGVWTRLESVQNAVDQAKCVARNIAGSPESYQKVPWFWSDQGAHKLQIAGLTGGSDYRFALHERGEVRFSAFCFKGGNFIGLETVNSPAEHMAARRLLALSKKFSLSDFKDVDFKIRDLATASAS